MAEWYEEAVGRCDDDMVAWLLFFAENPRKAGTGKTTDYHTQVSSAEAWLKRHGISADLKRGYDRLIRVDIPSPRGIDTLIRADKPNLIRLTSVAIGILQHLATRPGWRQQLLARLGAQVRVDEAWFPVPVGSDAYVHMVTKSDKAPPPCDLDVVATFRCLRCKSEVTHGYSMRWRDEEWAYTTVNCGQCGSVWLHPKGFPYAKPTPQNG